MFQSESIYVTHETKEFSMKTIAFSLTEINFIINGSENVRLYIQFFLMSQPELPIILVYYNFRGIGQPIRNILSFLDIPFVEIHMDRYQQQKPSLHLDITQQVQKFQINLSELPAIIHQNTYVQNVYPILIYLVKKLEHYSIMGSTIQIRSKVKQIMEIFFNRQSHVTLQILKYVQTTINKSDDQINSQSIQMYDQIMNNSKYIRQICLYLDQQTQPVYVFGQLTLIDFFFFQSAQYMLGLFDQQNRVDTLKYNQWLEQKNDCFEKPNAYYLNVMRLYRHKLMNKPYYIKNKDYLQSFTFISKMISPQRIEGIRKIWLGNPKFVA